MPLQSDSNMGKQLFQNGNKAARKHGIRALEDAGPKSLEPQQVGRLQELRQLVRTHPGRMELRIELTARAALIVDLAMSELTRHADSGESIFDSMVIKRGGTWFAELRRLLADFPEDSSDHAELAHIYTVIQEAEDNDNDAG